MIAGVFIFSLLVLFSRRAYYLRAWLRLVYTVLKSMPHAPVVQKLALIVQSTANNMHAL